MCYSAQIEAQWRTYARRFGAQLSLADFYELFRRRAKEAASIDVPRAIEAAFADSQDDTGREIQALIAEHRAAQAARFEKTLFEQRTRLVDAERKLASKTTKVAQESRRIATEKVAWAQRKLADLRRTQPVPDDSRIFPGWYTLVMVEQQGRRVVLPMRYQCRPAGKPAFYDRKFPGTFNARRDNLEGFWRDLFGHSHGVMLWHGFFEHVERDGADAVIEFRPQSGEPMLVACLWSRWSAPGEPELLSVAAITDEPPSEVAAAGHDRCVIPLREENLDAWLRPDPRQLADQQAILDDRERPYYEHRLAA